MEDMLIRKKVILLILISSLLAMGLTANAAGSQAQDNEKLMFVWMSDTQNLTHQTYEAMTQWIVDNKDAENIRYVIHTGDIIGTNIKSRWKNADAAMQTLDGIVPYGVLAGNHDIRKSKANYQRFFGQQRFEDNGVYGGSFQDNIGHYDLLSAGGKDFIFVYLSVYPSKDAIQWANQVLSAHPQRAAVLCTHSYIGTNNKLTTEGSRLFQQVVKPNPNVKLVLCGHKRGEGMLKQEIAQEDGTQRIVYAMLANYQSKAKGGGGRMRIIEVDPLTDIFTFYTFSPVMDVSEKMSSAAMPLSIAL
jgi:hypothetical protein